MEIGLKEHECIIMIANRMLTDTLEPSEGFLGARERFKVQYS
jgi:hypothetical protein